MTDPAVTATSDARRSHSHNPIVRYFTVLGPGLITGAADDDPSGIATYSVAGAAYGYGLLWTAGATFPLMAAIQLACARIGIVSRHGLAEAIRRHYPRPALYAACGLLLAANIFNIAADLAGMADAIEMLTGVSSIVMVPAIGILITVVTVFVHYRTLAACLKWLTAILFCYFVAAFLAGPAWKDVLRASLVPSFSWQRDWVMTLVGILGTTISPYLFFWQASQEVEEQHRRRAEPSQTPGALDHELRDARLDVITGMFFSNLVMYFIILTTSATLHQAGIRDIETSRQAAEALRPLAGNAASLLFTLGIVGTGLLAIPILAGSASYAVAELFRWRAGLDLRLRQGRKFYVVFAAAMLLGIAIDVLRVPAVRMLFLAAVVNAVLAPPLMALVMLIAGNPKVMGRHVAGVWLRLLGWGATAIMTLAVITFFVLTIVS